MIITSIADHILSPIGQTSEETFRNLRAGDTAMRVHAFPGVPEAVCASLLDEEALRPLYEALSLKERFTTFEKRLILSISSAAARTDIDLASDRVLFILSTTKGNISLLDQAEDFPPERVHLGVSARRIARHFGNERMPIVVSNACISGVCALLTGMRALREGWCDYAVVAGTDVQSRFIITGFQSFKALSQAPCRPFDAARDGLNPGEAAATVILTRAETAPWEWVRGAVRNDANHISGPSRTGEGSFQALEAALQGVDRRELAFVNVHGTATAYNDEMESIALHRAGLDAVPVTGLKGVFGHTMGAAGILECILSMRALEAGVVLPTAGYDTCGVSYPLQISNVERPAKGNAFVKVISGFGGCNAALTVRKR